ncbi:hypothetical protein JKF63_02381 [Porcisia hertigi]|uniref:Uncharacterized protein n=1 Tax=Porcisia hertigi TaxID=2761500 RepID=A0A836I9F2_9TRYP|nr:hypothetical protein JKF63_02381 [Porcisia hertigi]
MDIDLRDRDIVRLCFDAEETSKEEATVASAVAVLLADHNRIDRVSGLSAVFVNLVELRLSHNELGRRSTPYCRVRQTYLRDPADASRCCDGVASWIRCLPATLQVIAVAFNNIQSFLECSCECASSPEPYVAETEVRSPFPDTAVSLERQLRHRWPFALSLFFPAQRFPQLRELELSHNDFNVSLQESDEMQDGNAALEAAWAAHAITAATPATLSFVNLSNNQGLAALNCFFLSIPPGAGASANGAQAAQSSVLPCCLVSVAHTGIEDLQGISSISGHDAAAQWDMQLHPSPVSRSILCATSSSLLQLTHAIVSARADGDQDAMTAALTKVTSDEGTSTAAIARFQSVAQLDVLEQIAAAAVSREEPAMGAVLPDGATWVSTLAYACLLRRVVPTLRTLDQFFDVERCEKLFFSSLCQLLLGDPRPDRQSWSSPSPLKGPPQLHPKTPAAIAVLAHRGLGGPAHCVAPELQSRIVVGVEAPTVGEAQVGIGAVGASVAGAAVAVRPGQFREALAALRPGHCSSAAPPATTTRTPSCHSTMNASSVRGEDGATLKIGSDAFTSVSGEDWFTPSGLTPEEGVLYESLCREAKELQEAVLASNKRCREVRAHTDALQRQLTQDRTLVADQSKEIGRLRLEREHLQTNVGRARQRLEKRQREVTYGITAMQSREAAAREKAAMKRFAAREKELARRERQLRQRAARSGALAVEYHTDGASEQRRKLRSEVLREAAVRRRLAEQGNKDPLSYSPVPFKADMRRRSPRTSPTQRPQPHIDTEEERAYFRLYEEVGTPELREVADQYVAHLPRAQQLQLREASSQLPSSGSRVESRGRGRRTSPSQPRGSSTRSGGGDPLLNCTEARAATSPTTSPEAPRDLSSLSLSELLDAAATIRQKQLALQQFQQQLRRPPPPPPPPPILSPGGEEATHVVDPVMHTASESSSHHHHHHHGSGSVYGTDGGDASAAHTPLPEAHLKAKANHRHSPLSSPPCGQEGPAPNTAQQLFDRMLEQRAVAAAQLVTASGSTKSVKTLSVPRGTVLSTKQGDWHFLQDLCEEEHGDTTGALTSDTLTGNSAATAAGRPQTYRALFR